MCLAHLLRDSKYAEQDGDTVFAPGFRRLLLRAAAIGKRRDALKDTTLAQYHADLDRRLSRLLSGPAPTHKPARRLFRAMRRDRDDLFRFVTRRDVPYTNNACERALRPSVIRGSSPRTSLPQGDELLPRRVGCPSLRRSGKRDGHRTVAWAYRARGPPRRTRRRAGYAIRVIAALGGEELRTALWRGEVSAASDKPGDDRGARCAA
jgi:hypothetical protein